MYTQNHYTPDPANMSKRDIINADITIFDLKVRTNNVLNKKQIKIVSDLIVLTEDKILKFANAGVGTVDDVRSALSEVDLRLGMSEFDIEKILHEENPIYLAELEEKEKIHLAEAKCSFDKISIPNELSNLPILSILLMSDHIDFRGKYGPIERIKGAFNTLGDLNGHSLESLKQIRNIGRTVVTIINHWFEYFIPGTYESISDKFQYYSSFSCQQIDCSPYLRDYLEKNSISTIDDIKQIDNLILQKPASVHGFNNVEVYRSLTDLERLCLLELRTLRTDGKIFFTNSNAKGNKIDFISWIDKFMKKFKKEWAHMLVLKWNNGDFYLEDVGKQLGITRERVRQVVRGKTIEHFQMFYIYDMNLIYQYWFSIISNKLTPLNIKTNSSNEYNSSFYLGFINNIFPCLPMNGYLFTSHQGWLVSKTDGWYGEKGKNCYRYLLEESKKVNSLQISTFLSHYQTYVGKLWAMKVLLSLTDGVEGGINNSLIIAKTNDNDCIIKRGKLPLITLLKEILYKSEKPLSTDELNKLVSQSSQSKKTYKKSIIYSTCLNIDIAIMFDWHTFGIEKHLAYDKSIWNSISDDCEKVFKDGVMQKSIATIYNNIVDNYPNLYSKYELMHILRQSESFKYLGARYFTLSTAGLEERLTVKNIIYDLFNEDPAPKRSITIYNYIRRFSTIRREGMSQILKQGSYISYSCGYYGLPDRHEENISDLYNNIKYVESYITSLQLETSVELIAEYFELDDSSDLTDKIEVIDSLRIIKDPFSDKQFVLRVPSPTLIKSGQTFRAFEGIVRIVLYNCTKPLTIEEIKYFCMVSPSKDHERWFKLQKNLDNMIIKIIKSNKNYLILENGSILFAGDKERNNELIEIQGQTIDYIGSVGESVSLYDLYELVSDLSDSLNSVDELKHLLNTDERIEINDGIVSLIDLDD